MHRNRIQTNGWLCSRTRGSNSLGSTKRPGRVVVIFLLIVAAFPAIGVYLLRSGVPSQSKGKIDPEKVLVHTVQPGGFVSLVTESGDLESASNLEIHCEVKSPGGAAGSPILQIVPEGTMVQPGDFLVQFDDSSLQIDLTQQEILVATDQAAVILAQSELDKAGQTLKEYQQGLLLIEQETMESELFQAESSLKRMQDLLAHTQRMFTKGYVSRVQLEADVLAVEMATKTANAAKTKLMVLRQFTSQKMIRSYEAEIEKQKASLTAAQFTLKLSQQRRDELKEQINKCRILAPVAGQVVYANDYNRFPRVVIEAGAQIRQGQLILSLPDPNQMQVDMRISDSKINLVKVGQKADIVSDVDSTLKIRGEVVKVEPFPFPREWKGGPIEYGATVRVVNPPPGVKPGQRAKVHICVDRRDQVLQVPIQSVVARDNNHYCLIKTDQGDWDVRVLNIGPSNDSFVVVENGVNEGDQVALNPDRIWDDAVTTTPQPSASPPQTAGPKLSGIGR